VEDSPLPKNVPFSFLFPFLRRIRERRPLSFSPSFFASIVSFSPPFPEDTKLESSPCLIVSFLKLGKRDSFLSWKDFFFLEAPSAVFFFPCSYAGSNSRHRSLPFLFFPLRVCKRVGACGRSLLTSCDRPFSFLAQIVRNAVLLPLPRSSVPPSSPLFFFFFSSGRHKDERQAHPRPFERSFLFPVNGDLSHRDLSWSPSVRASFLPNLFFSFFFREEIGEGDLLLPLKVGHHDPFFLFFFFTKLRVRGAFFFYPRSQSTVWSPLFFFRYSQEAFFPPPQLAAFPSAHCSLLSFNRLSRVFASSATPTLHAEINRFFFS